MKERLEIKCLMRSSLLLVSIFRVQSFVPKNEFQSLEFSAINSRSSEKIKLFSINPNDNQAQSADNESSTTYFSPNRPLDDTKYTYSDEKSAEGIPIDADESSSSTNEYSFFDEATIYVRAGSGGQGSSTYKKGVGGQQGPPDGGNGGRGGNVILIVDESLNTLAGLTNAWRPNSFGGSGAASTAGAREQRKSFRAENGMDGMRQLKSGRYGKEVTIRVPPGTVVQELMENNDDDDGSERVLDIGTVTLDQPSLIVARGGEGGEGSGVGGKGRGVRRVRIPPEGGERKLLKLTLKIVADVALVGVPNCGKSTLLASVTRAKPKIANVSTVLILFLFYGVQ
jgi:GTPase